MNHDWLPRRREEQLAMAKKWVAELPNHLGRWQVTPAEITMLEECIEDVEDALRRQMENAGPVENARVRETFAALVSYMRGLHRRKFFSPPMEDSDWIRLGLKPPDRIRTEHHKVPELVEFELKLRGIREIIVDFWIKGSASKAKPDGYDGAVLIWGIADLRSGDEPPSGTFDLTRHTMASKMPHALKFPNDEDRGKTAKKPLAFWLGVCASYFVTKRKLHTFIRGVLPMAKLLSYPA